MRTVLLALLIAVSTCSCQPTIEHDELNLEVEDVAQKATQKFSQDQVVGHWVSTHEYRAGERRTLDGTHELELKEDGKFSSNFKPQNLKEGRWGFKDNSVIELYLKAIDPYRILELTDSSMSCHLEFITHDSIVINYKRVY